MIIKIIIFNFFLYIKKIYSFKYGDWGLGIGDWGFGGWANPPYPIHTNQ